MSNSGPVQEKIPACGLDEKSFKAQLEFHNSCQSFASEVLRLSLGGIAVVGFLLTLLSRTSQDTPILTERNLLSDLYLGRLLLGSTIFLGVGSVLAMSEKYCESSTLYHHLRAEGMSFPSEKDNEDNSIQTHRRKQNKYFRLSQKLLFLAAACLLLGAFGLIGALVQFTRLVE